MTGKGTSPVAGKQQRFLWRGLLIVLPALAMAGFGFVSLRQDRLLVRHQATEQAGKLVSELVQAVIPAALHVELPLPDATGLSTTLDPILGAAQDGIIAALTDTSGATVYPPPSRWPLPEPLELQLLDAAQLDLWTTARRELFSGADSGAAMKQFDQVIEAGLPERFEALARFHLFNLALRTGQSSNGLHQLEQTRQRFGTAKTESGLLVRLLAEWGGLRLIDAQTVLDPAMEKNVSWLCAQSVLDPGPVSSAILEQVRQFGSQHPQARFTRYWTDVWDAHQRSRALGEVLVDRRSGHPLNERKGGDGWVKFDDRDYLILRQPADQRTWLLAWSEQALRVQVGRALDVVSLPAEFGCSIAVDGRMLTSPQSTEPALASSTVPFDEDAGPELTAAIWLANPELLYARQRKRTWWFGSLIVVSVASVLGGAVAAWRGFRDQQRLGELKSNFVSSVSHEMRAPIASVRLMAEELVDRGPSDPVKAAEYHGYILQECRRLSALIENVLDFSRHEQGRKQYQFEPTDLGQIVEETIHVMASYAADRKVTLERRIDGAPFEVDVDAAAMRQVLVNLLDNAIKHSPAGATVEVALAYPEAAPAPVAGRESSANGTPPVRLTVRDHGPGIPADEQRLIFQRFYRRGSELRRETQGIGLGLAIVQYIVEAHGASVGVESQVGKGSRFIVELPAERKIMA